MSWFPVGPDFVFSPRDPNYLRLSRRNELGRQASVTEIAVDSTDVETIYVISRPQPLFRSSAFRTRDGGRSWAAISDGLQSADWTVDPNAIAVNPRNPSVVYLALVPNGSFCTSNDRGDTWSSAVPVGANIFVLVIDPRTVTSPASTTLYGGTDDGIYRSDDSGATWSRWKGRGLRVWSLVVDTAGTAARFWVGATGLRPNGSWGAAVYYADDAGAWTDLNALGIGLPTSTNGLSRVYLASCPLNPSRLYAWFFDYSGPASAGLFTTSDPLNRWDRVLVSGDEPRPDWWWHAFAFAAAPNSPGDFDHDILFFGRINLLRSLNGGRTWESEADTGYGPDYHVFAFAPAAPAPGVIPRFYSGSDAGVAMSTGLADPAFLFGRRPTYFNERFVYDTRSPLIQNIDHGRQSVALAAYASHPGFSALSYVSSADTGVAAGTGSVWRDITGTDDYGAVAVAPGNAGMTVFMALNGTPFVATDRGTFSAFVQRRNVTIGGGGVDGSTSNLVATADGRCLAGAWQTRTPDRHFVIRIDPTGAATQVSQDFAGGQPGMSSDVVIVDASPTDPDLFCAVTRDRRLWLTTSGSTASSTTVWSEPTTARPPLLADVADVAIDAAGSIFVLFESETNGTLLCRVDNGVWAALPSSGLPRTSGFGKLAVDPLRPNVLYASNEGQVFEVTGDSAGWTWRDITEQLPGTKIVTLWAEDIGTAAEPRVLLRAGTDTRGVWERDVTPGSTAPGVALYVRDNLLDQGWLSRSPEGITNPLRPTEQVWHYQCADIKVDAGTRRRRRLFYQTDPEGGPLPLDHVQFEQLRDDSNISTGDDVWVHAQVHNRALIPATDVSVWAIYCNASAGVPGLNMSPSNADMFPFWSQFAADGTITPSLPSDSPWTPIGPPQVLPEVAAHRPAIASWLWRTPSTDPDNHVCIAMFVHSATAPLSETSMNLDAITPTNRQIGQKNLHVIDDWPDWWLNPRLKRRESIEFHNASEDSREVDLVFDLRALPAKASISFRTTHVDLSAPRQRSVHGISAVKRYRRGAFEALLRRNEKALEPWSYRVEPASTAVLGGVRLPPGGSCRAVLSIRAPRRLFSARDHRFEIQQRVDDRIIGGSTYVIRGRPRPDPEREPAAEEWPEETTLPWLMQLDRTRKRRLAFLDGPKPSVRD